MADIWGAAPRLMRQDALSFLRPDLNGAGQTVAVIDTGIDYNHPGLGGGFGDGKKVIAGHDFVDDDDDPMDTDGHGTEVAGVIAADQFSQGGFTYQGIAPGAKLIALRIAEDTSAVPLERIEAALKWVVDHAQQYHIVAVNLSFGFDRFASQYKDPTIGDELATIAARDIAFVSSAGNGGADDGLGINYPAADATSFGVGSVNTSDVISEFSQRSANLSMLAVGENVHTTVLGSGYGTVNGTSFAAPAVAGTIALIRQVDPQFTRSDIRSIFRASLPTNYDGDAETGNTSKVTYQRLDILSAVSTAIQRESGTPPQQALVGSNGNDSDIAFDQLGVLHFVYYDSDAKRMMYATRSVNGRWSIPSVIDDREGIGYSLSMKLDSYGRPNLAYLNGDRLNFARFNGERWDIQTLDSNRITGLDPSLVIDSSDRAYVAYFRKTSGDLKLASRDLSGNWSRQTLDSDGYTGITPKIVLDSLQRLAIAYIDGGRDLLKLTRQKSDGTWTTSVVEKTTGDAAYVSLAFDVANTPSLSYYETKTADLKFATMDDGEWQVTRLASRGAVGLYTNLQLDDDGRPSILYWERRTGALMLQTYNGTKWSATSIVRDTGKYVTAQRSNITGKWTYAASNGEKLVFGEV